MFCCFFVGGLGCIIPLLLRVRTLPPEQKERKKRKPVIIPRMPAPSENTLLNSAGGDKAFLYGEGGETDDFLAGITGGKPKYRAKKNYEQSVDTDNSDHVAPNYYAPDYKGDNSKDATCGVKNCRSRAAMVVVSLIFIAGGAVTMALLDHNMEYLQHLWPLAFFSMNVLGALFVLGGVTSIAAAVADRDLWRRGALFVIMLACAGVVMGFVFATLLRSGHEDDALLSDWTQMVRSDPRRVCTIEGDLNCTGWTTACGPPNGDRNMTEQEQREEMRDAAVEMGIALDGPAGLGLARLAPAVRKMLLAGNTTPQCVDTCVLSIYHNVNQTCAAALQARVRQDYPAAIAALAFAVVWTAAFTALVVVRRDVATGYGSLQA